MLSVLTLPHNNLPQAPEVFNGQPYNQTADIFSFAIVCYELLHRRLILSSILEKHFGAPHHVIEKVWGRRASLASG